MRVSVTTKMMTVVGLMVCATTAMATPGTYIFADGIDGGSNGYPNLTASEVNSYSANFAEGQCGEIVVEKPFDRASPKYLAAAFNGTLLPRIQIFVREGSPEGEYDSVRLELKDSTVTRIETPIRNGETREVMSVLPTELKMTFTEVDDRGRPLGNVETTVVCVKKVK